MEKIMERLREIAGRVVKQYQSDLEHDEQLLRDNPGAEFIWLPYESGTRIAFLLPHWREYGLVVAEFYQRNFTGLTPYRCDPESGRVKPVSWDEVERLLKAVPEPEYMVRYADGVEGPRFRNRALVERQLEGVLPGAQVVEVHSQRVLSTVA